MQTVGSGETRALISSGIITSFYWRSPSIEHDILTAGGTRIVSVFAVNDLDDVGKVSIIRGPEVGLVRIDDVVALATEGVRCPFKTSDGLVVGQIDAEEWGYVREGVSVVEY